MSGSACFQDGPPAIPSSLLPPARPRLLELNNQELASLSSAFCSVPLSQVSERRRPQMSGLKETLQGPKNYKAKKKSANISNVVSKTSIKYGQKCCP